MTRGIGLKAPTAEQAIIESYNRNETDEYIKPYVINKKGLIKNGDSIIFFNLRSDRARSWLKFSCRKNFYQAQSQILYQGKRLWKI